MRKLFLLIISILTMTTTVMAQDAEQMFKATVDKLKAYNNIEIAFDYQMKNEGAGINELMTGTGFLQGDAYKVKMASQDIICDGTTTWTYLADSQEVMISSVDADSDNSPLAIINAYYDNINAKFIDNGNSHQKCIEATPKATDAAFTKLKVIIDTKSLNLKEIHIFDSNDNEFVISITKFVTNQTLPDNFFIFNEKDYPDAEVIDMR